MTEITPSDFWEMYLSTVRYSMGRRSYMPTVCVHLYEKYSSLLTVDQRRQIGREIYEELQRSEKRKETLGMRCDHRTWTKFCEMIATELYNEGHKCTSKNTMHYEE